jgi:hypothetical protein
MAKPDSIPDAVAVDDAATMPDELLLHGPFAVVHDCELMERGGAKCETCQQPACAGAGAVLQCDCGQLFRVNLLANDNQPHGCPGCDKTYSTVLIVCEPDNSEAFLEALAVVLRSNGYQVANPADDDEEDDAGELGADDDEEDDEDEDREATEDDEDDAGGEPQE